MKKLRIIPILITLAVSTGLLFGGWSLFRHQVKEGPLQAAIASIPAVSAAQATWQAKQLVITLEVKPDSNLRAAVQQAYKTAIEHTKDAEVSIQIQNTKASASLEAWWSKALFSVAEALSHQKYSDIPVKLEQQKAALPGIEVFTEMDEYFVYITLKHGTDTKMILLPLKGERMGVWPNAEVPKILA